MKFFGPFSPNQTLLRKLVDLGQSFWWLIWWVIWDDRYRNRIYTTEDEQVDAYWCRMMRFLMTKCYLLLTFCSPNAKCLVDVSFFANNVSNCLVSILFVCIFALVFEQNIFVDNIPADFTVKKCGTRKALRVEKINTININQVWNNYFLAWPWHWVCAFWEQHKHKLLNLSTSVGCCQ